MVLDLEQEMCDMLNWEICIELFKEAHYDLPESEIEKYFSIAKKNGADAVILYELTRLKSQEE